MAPVPRGLCCKGGSIVSQPILFSRLSNGALKGRFRYRRHVDVQRFCIIQHLGIECQRRLAVDCWG
jgi:hypothetical protein